MEFVFYVSILNIFDIYKFSAQWTNFFGDSLSQVI